MGFNLSEWALRHRSLVLYMMLVTAIAGVLSFGALGRDEDPPFTIKTMVVKVLWPGASLEETTNQITDRIEKKLEETPSLDYLKSYTRAGETVIFVNLKDTTSPSQVSDIWYQVRKKTTDIRHTLPSDIQGPFFNDEFGDTFGIIYAFTAEGFSQRELRDYVESVRSNLVNLPDMGKITLIGAQDETVTVEFSTRKLASLGLTQAQLVESLHEQNSVMPAGVIDAGGQRILMRVSGGFESEADLANINLRIAGRFFRLADIAEITRGYADPPSPLYRVNGKPAIGLAISMAKGGDILTLGERIHVEMTKLERDRPLGIEVIQVTDQPTVVETSVHHFIKALVEAVVIVLVVSFVSLGMRAGTVVALSIPLVLGATFVGMEIWGIGLHRISLGALIIALGLLVDDAMITVEMMIKKLEEGFSLVKAATFAYTSTAFPMLTGTLVTAFGFVPVGFAKSGAGEYSFAIFAVVTLALLISWVVAVLFSPLIGVAILSPTPKPHKEGGLSGRMSDGFHHLLVICLRHRFKVIAGTVGLFLLSLAGATQLEQQFFPTSERPELLVQLTLPNDNSIRNAERAVHHLEAHLAADPDVASYAINVGSGAVRFYLPMDVQLEHPYFAEAVVVAKDMETRAAVADRLRAFVADEMPEAVLRASPLEMGPPVGWPVKYRISGTDPEKVRQIAYDVAGAVHANPNIRSVNFDWNEPIRTVRLRVDQDKVRLLGLSSEELAQVLNTTFSGTTVTRLRDAIYLVDVRLRAAGIERNDLDTLRMLQIPLGDGRSVPLMEVATVEYGFEAPILWRRDRLNTLTVQADVIPGIQPATAVGQLDLAIQNIMEKLPTDYKIEIGGSVEESAKGMQSVMAVVPVMILLMLTVLMVQLQSFQRLILVVSVAPLGLIGVVGIMLPTGTPMGFIAILGCVALIGMIIRNSVILIDQIETDIAAGHDRWSAIVEATCHRFRPILLTAAAAILAMIPIASDSFWRPMAMAIMGGLLVATLLTLLFLPAAYAAWFRVPEPVNDDGGLPVGSGDEPYAMPAG
ncbi:efflux RND transporter permease subunit [Thalassospira australica]|uniref:efflux RND transporter permease subunit n=1 Tax=Thalassospira australica TaxID=1528106 RepID=UPI003851047F